MLLYLSAPEHVNSRMVGKALRGIPSAGEDHDDRGPAF